MSRSKVFGPIGSMIKGGIMMLLKGGMMLLLIAVNLGLIYQLVYGPRGQLVYLGLEDQIAEAQAELEEVKAASRWLEHRVSLLDPEQVSYDMLEEQARAVLGFRRPNEHLILIEDLLPEAIE